MTDSLLLMMALGRRMDAPTLRASTQRARIRREKIFTRLIDLLFGVVMLVVGELAVTIKNKDGIAVDPTDSSVSDDDRLNAVLAAQKALNKSTLFREVARPLLIAAASFIADMMGPDEN